MSKYHVGDAVRVRGDLMDDELYGNQIFIGDDMMECRGRLAMITKVDDAGYNIDICPQYFWTDEMFEDGVKDDTIKDNTAMTVEDLLNKTDVEKGGLVISIFYPNAYFETTIGHNKINRNSELYKRFIKAYGDMIVDEVSFDIRSENMVVMSIKVDYCD